MYNVNSTLCSKTDEVVTNFLSVFVLKSDFSFSFNWPSISKVLSLLRYKTFCWKEFQHFQPLS